MLIIIFALFAACLVGANFAKPGEFHRDYLSKEVTTAVNGIFVMLVFLTHFKQYVTLSNGAVDSLYLQFNKGMGQLVVTTFLFYSGYGIMCSVKAKSQAYVNTIPRKRILSVWLHFIAAVSLFLITALAIGKEYSLKTILLAFTGWTSIGNSNWYIFAVLFLYLFVFISFKICKDHCFWATVITSVLTVVWVYIMIRAKRPPYTYNTVVCYLAGMFYAMAKPKLDRLIMSSDLVYSLFLALAVGATALFYTYRNTGVVAHGLWSLAFVAVIVLVTMKVRLSNGFLAFLGSHVFGIYILQRLPMIVLTHFGLNSKPYVLLMLSFVITVPMTFAFDALMKILDKKLKLV